MTYAQQHRLYSHGTARTAEHVAAVLERVSPRQRHLLAWYAQGYTDVQVAARLGMTPQSDREARHGAYRALRTPLCLPGPQQRAASPTHTEKNFARPKHFEPLQASL